MTTIGDLRNEYGSSFVLELPDGQIIPWKPLSIGERLEYENLLKNQLIPRVVIEDEIFRKCCLNKVLVENYYKLKAGTITAVVEAVMTHSAPNSPEEFNYVLELNRSALNQNPIHLMVTIICLAFSSYSPDDVYAMDYQTFMFRLAQAENKLLQMGLISEPINLIPNDQPQEKQSKKKNKIDPKKLKDLYDEMNIKENPSLEKKKRKKVVSNYRDIEFPSAPTSKPNKQTIISADEMHEIEDFLYTGHEKENALVDGYQMLKATLPVYQEYVNQIKEDGKLRILTPEERKERFQQRMAEKRRKYEMMKAQRKKTNKKDK